MTMTPCSIFKQPACRHRTCGSHPGVTCSRSCLSSSLSTGTVSRISCICSNSWAPGGNSWPNSWLSYISGQKGWPASVKKEEEGGMNCEVTEMWVGNAAGISWSQPPEKFSVKNFPKKLCKYYHIPQLHTYHNYFIAASKYWSKYTLNYKDKALWRQYSIFDSNLHMCPNISLFPYVQKCWWFLTPTVLRITRFLTLVLWICNEMFIEMSNHYKHLMLF